MAGCWWSAPTGAASAVATVRLLAEEGRDTAWTTVLAQWALSRSRVCNSSAIEISKGQ